FLFAGRADCLEDFVDELRIVRRPDRHRIADFIIQSPAGEIDFKMAAVFLGTFAAKAAIDGQLSREWIRPRVLGRRFRSGRWSFSRHVVAAIADRGAGYGPSL